MSTDSVVFAFSKESAKDFGKKKRINRSAKLKQCKLDARREQWLSQVKNKGGKEESVGGGGSSMSSMPVNSLGNSEVKSRGKDIERSSLNDSDMESSINSSVTSILGSHDLCKDSVGSSRGSSISSVCGGCYCESGDDEEEEEEEANDDDDGCADDWETVADALTADDKQHHSNLGNLTEIKSPVVSTISKSADKICEIDGLKVRCDGPVSRAAAKGHAWRPDDAFRPQSLPTLSKQYSFPMNAERCCGRGAGSWIHSVVSQPTSCPICYEDLDRTDSSFRPCLCGFRLCLFCHKRILEADGRCPGCRKQYESAKGEVVVNGGPPPFRLTRSFSMSTRQQRPSVYRITLYQVPAHCKMHAFVSGQGGVSYPSNIKCKCRGTCIICYMLLAFGAMLLALECAWSFSCLLHLKIAKGNDEFRYLMYFSIVKLGHYYLWRGRIM